MKNIRLYLFFIILLVLSIHSSLSFAIFSKSSGIISGRVIDERNFPVPFAKILVNNVEGETDRLGNFKVLDVRFPYDITVAEQSTSTAIIYKGLSIENPDLILFGKPNPRNANRAIITVNFPQIPNGSSTIVKFISQDVFYCEDIEALTGEKSKTLIVYWPVSKKSIDGNIIFLQKNNIAYEQYLDKPSSLFQTSIPFEVTFSSGSNNITPTSDLTVYLPFQDSKVKGYSVFADFFSYDRNSEVLLTRQEGNIYQTKSIIPSILPISYRLKVSGYADYSDGSGFVNYTYSKPGATININSEDPPELKTPTDKFKGASGNTEFSYSLGSGTGIFVVRYHSFYPVMDFYIVTSESRAYLDYLSREEFTRNASVEFKWNAKKYLTYISVNDFVKPKLFNNDIGYKAVLYSSERTFKTGYF